ncbi:MAG: hypothetical protein IPJ07_20540 [Acidobacteria bacterium]|nr:hypothetical protein [Acidobacteriota bacterium]
MQRAPGFADNRGKERSKSPDEVITADTVEWLTRKCARQQREAGYLDLVSRLDCGDGGQRALKSGIRPSKPHLRRLRRRI